MPKFYVPLTNKNWKAGDRLSKRLNSFQSDPEWIAKRIGISTVKVTDALLRLKRLGMLTENSRGRLQRGHPAYRTTDDVANATVQKSHFQTLELAKKLLEEDPVDIRDFTWLTLAVQKSRIKEMKELVRKFQAEFVELFGKDTDADEIYRVSVQMVPITKTEK